MVEAHVPVDVGGGVLAQLACQQREVRLFHLHAGIEGVRDEGGVVMVIPSQVCGEHVVHAIVIKQVLVQVEDVVV